jgi:hypothetical protein
MPLHDPNVHAGHQRLPPAAADGGVSTHNVYHLLHLPSGGKEMDIDGDTSSPSSQMSDIRAASPISVLLQASDRIAAREADKST